MSEETPKDVCQSVNKQFYGTDGKLSDIQCELHANHTGDHQAKYERKVADYIHNEKGQIIKTEYHLEPATASWNDFAEQKVEEYKELPAIQMNALQRDLVMDVLQKNPNLKIEEAIERAKASEGWNLKLA